MDQTSNWYRLHVSTDAKVIGAKDGCAVVISETPSLKTYKKIPEFERVSGIADPLDCFELLEKSKLIDFLVCANNYSTTGIIVSGSVKKIFQTFNLYSVQFVPVILQKKGKPIEDYYLMHVYSYLLDKIDYSKTTFSRIWPFPREVEESYGSISEKRLREEGKKYAGSVSFIEPDAGYFFDKFDFNSFDMFRVGYVDDFLYISQKLKDALSGLKGVEFTIANIFN